MCLIHLDYFNFLTLLESAKYFALNPPKIMGDITGEITVFMESI